MKQTNTLGSWIDLAELSRLTNALAPDDSEAGGEGDGAALGEVPDMTGVGRPKRELDIDEPSAYRAAPFPEQMPEPGEASGELDKKGQWQDEGPVLRAARALAEVRLRAEENGFLKRRELKTVYPGSPAIAVPPVFDWKQEASEQSGLTAPHLGGQVSIDTAAADSFEIPQGPLRERLDAFVDWAMRLTRASRMVIVDGQGYSLLHRDLESQASEGDAAVVDSAMRLTSVLEQVQARTDFARDGALNLPLEEGGWLGVLRCENAGGRLCIALVTAAPLEIAQSALMKNELARTMAAGS
jgi:hypothetical protein